MSQILLLILLLISDLLIGCVCAIVIVYFIEKLLKDRNLRKQIWGLGYRFDREDIGCGKTKIWENKKLMFEYDNHIGVVRALLNKIDQLETKLEDRVNWVNNKVENKQDKKVK